MSFSSFNRNLHTSIKNEFWYITPQAQEKRLAVVAVSDDGDELAGRTAIMTSTGQWSPTLFEVKRSKCQIDVSLHSSECQSSGSLYLYYIVYGE